MISHNIGHVYSVADRFILMSKGAKKVDVEKDSVSLTELEDMLIGL